jgi:rhomboid protease GluP
MNYTQGNGENTPPSTPDNSYTAETARPQTQIQVKFNGSKPVVVYVILAITVLAYIFQAGSQYLTGVDLGFAMGGKINSLIVAGQYWRLFTPMLLHGSLIHILLNMYALIILGRGL